MFSSLTSKSCCVCFSDFFSFAESLSLSSLSTIPLRRLNTLRPASVFMLVALADGWFTADPVRALLVGRRPLLSVSEDATTGWIITYRLKLYTLKTSNWNPSLATNFRDTASQLMSRHNHATLEKQTQNYQLLHTLDEHKRNSPKGGETEDYNGFNKDKIPKQPVKFSQFA